MDSPCNAGLSLILAGDTLFAGGDGKVIAYDAKDGKQVWAADVAGKAYGLAVADGRLFVSTDLGAIHCFEPNAYFRIRRYPPSPVAPPEDSQTTVYAATADRIVSLAGTCTGIVLIGDVTKGGWRVNWRGAPRI